MDNLIVYNCTNCDFIKIINLLLQVIITFTAVFLPIYTLRETNKENRKQLILKDKIEKTSLLYSLLSDWYIETLKIYNAIKNKEKISTKTIDTLFIEIAKNKIYQNENKEFKEGIYKLMDNTEALLKSDTNKCDEYRDKTMSAIKELQSMLHLEELN